MRILVLVAAIGGLSVLFANPGPKAKPGEEVLRRYLAKTSEQRAALRDVSMEVEIEAKLPDLKKTGHLRALRHISKVGKVTYEVVSFVGDNMVKKDVIARYMSAEVKSSNGNSDSIALTEQNYRFRYRGAYGNGDWKLHLFELKPKKKRAGLFEGWLWVEAESGLPVRESGRFVKTPSVFLRDVEFVRDYDHRDGVAVPLRIESSIRTRLVGLAQISISFGEPSFHQERPSLAATNRLP